MNQNSLFSTQLMIPIPGNQRHAQVSQLAYFEDIFDRTEADRLFEALHSEINWQQPEIRIAGKLKAIPRLQSWQGDDAHQYRYSGRTFVSEPWHPLVAKIQHKAELLTGKRFNSALCNLYRDGQDSVGWHADDEPELGSEPWIASVSLGATRSFHIKMKERFNENPETYSSLKLDLLHNSLLLMPPEMQHSCLHQLPKTRRCHQPRINLTFRYICA